MNELDANIQKLNIFLVAHCSLTGNSAMHVFSVAECLVNLGHKIAMFIPDSLESINIHRKPSFPIFLYDSVNHTNF